MAKRFALVDGGVVENVAVFPDDWDQASWTGLAAVACGDEQVGPGWTYAAGVFAPPVDEVSP